VETDMRPGFYFAEIKDYASKYAENLARLAAVLHFFSANDGDISLETIQGAEKKSVLGMQMNLSRYFW
jgi:hypothetical protein